MSVIYADMCKLCCHINNCVAKTVREKACKAKYSVFFVLVLYGKILFFYDNWTLEIGQEDFLMLI